MNQPTTTRRSLIRLGTIAAAYAAGAAIITGGIAAVSTAKGAEPAISPALAKLLAHYAAADARLDRFYAEAWNPACDRCNAIVEAIPHVEKESAPLDGTSSAVRWSTADKHSIGHARGIASIPNRLQSQTEAWQRRRREARSFYAAHLQRERALARAHRETGLDAADAEERILDAAANAHYDAITAFPCLTIADLAAKLDHIDRSGTEPLNLLQIVVADVRRLSGGEA